MNTRKRPNKHHQTNKAGPQDRKKEGIGNEKEKKQKYVITTKGGNEY